MILERQGYGFVAGLTFALRRRRTGPAAPSSRVGGTALDRTAYLTVGVITL